MRRRKPEQSESDFPADMLNEAIFISEVSDTLAKEVIQDKSLSEYIENWGKDRSDHALYLQVDGELVGTILWRLLMGDNRGFRFVDKANSASNLYWRLGFETVEGNREFLANEKKVERCKSELIWKASV